jgi:hypothetical protein
VDALRALLHELVARITGTDAAADHPLQTQVDEACDQLAAELGVKTTTTTDTTATTGDAAGAPSEPETVPTDQSGTTEPAAPPVDASPCAEKDARIAELEAQLASLQAAAAPAETPAQQ